MPKVIKIVLILLLLFCLADMPYGYYTLVRWAAMVGFAVLAYQASEEKNTNAVIVYIGLALLFQPFVKLALGRQPWNLVDVIVAVGLLLTILPSQTNKSNRG